jgi:hypothetical protein
MSRTRLEFRPWTLPKTTQTPNQLPRWASIACAIMLAFSAGCANRGWGFSWGQGTTNRQKARAAVHDPYPLNDIGPEVVGGRPREFFDPEPEAVRHQVTRPR